jgi:hypothetical protein
MQPDALISCHDNSASYCNRGTPGLLLNAFLLLLLLLLLLLA